MFKNRSISTFTVHTKIIKREICESITGDTYSILTKTYGRFQLLSSLFFELLSPFLTKIKKMKKKKKNTTKNAFIKSYFKLSWFWCSYVTGKNKTTFKLTLQELIQQILALCSISTPSENVRKPLVYNVFRGDRNGILS